MKLNAEDKLLVKQLYLNDKLSITAIAKRMGCHHRTVRTSLEDKADVPVKRFRKINFPSLLLSSKKTMLDLIERFPNISGTRMKEILNERGVRCGITSVREALIEIKGKKNRTVFQVRTFLPGQEAQVDWGELKVQIGDEHKKIYIFVMVLAYSKSLFAYVTLNMKMETFTGCHTMAFNRFKGVPRKILYDNLKTAVVERVGDAIRFSNHFYTYARHYLFTPIACHVRTPQEKGTVERNVQFLKQNFFNARTFTSLDDVNEQLTKWLDNRLLHNHPTNRKSTIAEYFSKEDLMPLPKEALYPRRSEIVKVGKQPYVNFESNRYSIPFKHAFNCLSLQVGMHDLEVYNQNELIACHVRSFEKDQIIQDKEHLDELCRHRSKSASNTYKRGYFMRLIPQTEPMFLALAKHNEPMLPLLKRIESAIKRYGIQKVENAFKQAEKENQIQMDIVEMILTKENATTNTNELILSSIPIKFQQIKTIHHDLKSYEINKEL